MATAPVTRSISVQEYLPMTFEYDAEYVDGHIEERPAPEFDHADMIASIIMLLRPYAKRWAYASPAIRAPRPWPHAFACLTSG